MKLPRDLSGDELVKALARLGEGFIITASSAYTWQH